MGKITRKPLNEAEQDAIAERAYYEAIEAEFQAERDAKEAYARELYIARKTTEIKAKLYDVVKSYYSDLDGLARRLQDDYASTTPFEQTEEDRLGLCSMLDYMDDLEDEINEIQEETHGITDKRKTELLGSFVGWFLDHQTSDEGLYRDLHVEIGMTKEELHDFSIESLDEQFILAEKEKHPINEENGEIKGSYFADEIREMLNPKDDTVVLEWLEFIRDISDDAESNFNKELGDTLRALYYVKNVYDEKTLQSSLRFCTLSNEIVKGAMYFSEGKSQEEVRELANQGLLMDGYVPSVNYGKDGEQNEQDETTDMITTEDIVEQVVYAANAPKCCADEHAKNMLGMLGASVVDEDIYHDEDDCPKHEQIDYKQAVIDSVRTEYSKYRQGFVEGATIQQILDGSKKYVAITALKDAIVKDVEFDDEIYVALYQDKGEILSKLYGDYCCNDEVNIRTSGDCMEFIEISARTNNGLAIDEYLEQQANKEIGMGGMK